MSYRMRTLPTFSACLAALLLLVGLTGCGDGGPGVEVADFAPQDEVERATNFTVVFSKDVVGDSLTNEPLDEAPITFSPEIPGQFQWIAPNKLRFYPDVMLAPSTEYTAKVQSSVVGAHGLALKGERTFTFHTPRLRVVSAFLNFEYDPESNKQATLVGTIEFNYEVAPDEVSENVSIRHKDGRRISYQLTTTAPSRVIEFEAASVEREVDERQIQLHVEEGAIGVGGNLGLASRYTRRVMLPGQNSLKVEQMTAVRESTASQYVRVRFNQPVRSDGAAPFFSIEPAVDVEATSTHIT